MKYLITSLFLLILTQTLFSQELSAPQMAELRSVSNEERMQNYVDNNPGITTEVVFMNSFDPKNNNDSLIFLLGFSGVREVRNDNGGISYYKLFESSSEPEYRVRTIFFDGTQMPLDRINSIRQEIISQIGSGKSYESQYDKFNMDDRPNYGDLGWVRAETLLEPFTSLVSMNSVGQTYIVDIPYMNWYYLAENTAKPVNQTRKKYLKVTMN